MKVRTKKKIERLSYTDIDVTRDTNGYIVFNWLMDNGECRHKRLQPREAVQVWRRMMGETDKDLHIFSPRLDVKYNDKDDSWTFSDDEVLCVLDLDECMLVAWAIEKAGGNALYNGKVHSVHDKDLKSDEKASYVWVLFSSSRPGPCSGDKKYCQRLGGDAKVFLSMDAALDGLREFLRDEVNKAHGYLAEELADHGRTVDDIIDEIIEMGSDEQGIWMYDGTKRSFVVQLRKEEIAK